MLKKILKYKFTSALSLISILLAGGGFIWTYATLRAMGAGPFLLHWNDMQGITAIGGLGMIVFMGVFGIIVTVMNGAIALEFEGRNPFFGKLIASLTLVFAILLFISFASIIAVN
jgi:hypothetical protein